MPGKNFVGKPCAGKPHARFDEGDRWIEHLKPVSTLPVEKKKIISHGLHGFARIM
jgi:hypothetical protein